MRTSIQTHNCEDNIHFKKQDRPHTCDVVATANTNHRAGLTTLTFISSQSNHPLCYIPTVVINLKGTFKSQSNAYKNNNNNNKINK